MVSHRLSHYAILLAVMAVLTLPNLGAHTLWDVDEGVNAEAAREMMEAGNWITPVFNFELRTAKPALLYWLQMVSYRAFGVNEFAARLPSVLAAMVTVLLVYELARNMHGAATGLLAGVVLASCLEFCLLAHAATPDSTLLMFTTATLHFFWVGSRDGRRWWFVPAGMAAGFAVLTKGPVGLVVPGLVIFSYFAWNRELRRLLDRRLVWGFLAFLAVAAPWYIVVTTETRGAWIKAFIARENVTRFMQPMENHHGPFFYHLVGILVLFAPWSVFLGVAGWNAAREARAVTETANERRAGRFLFCWAGAYVVLFSVAATKLPNYVLPAYPALAVLTARFVQRWRAGELVLPKWLDRGAIGGLAFVGAATAFGIALAGGLVPLRGLKMNPFPKLAPWWFIGLVPVLGAVAGGVFLFRQRKDRVVTAFAATSVAFTALIAALPVLALDEYKAPQRLVAQAGVNDPHRDLRLASLYWFQPSVVFYSRREVERLQTWDEAADRLAMRAPVYLFVPEPAWRQIQAQEPSALAYRTVARQYDFLKNCDVVVVTNQ